MIERTRPSSDPVDPRTESLQKRAALFGCSLYVLVVVVLGGIFLYHLLRG